MPRRSTPAGFRKTSYEFTEAVKYALEDLVSSLDRNGYNGLSETVLLEALVIAAKRKGVDRAVLDRVIRARRTAQDRAERAR
jgi:hypothetical protein